MPILKIKKNNVNAKMPEYKSDQAAGFDICACRTEDGDWEPSSKIGNWFTVIQPGEIKVIKTGLSFELENGYEAQIRPRSGLAIKHGITLVNSIGTIDSDYRGEIMVGLINLSKDIYYIESGERIAQVVIAPVEKVEIQEADHLSDTKRGTGGIGSTGRK